VRSGYVEATAGAAQGSGAFGRLEAGVRPWERVGVFTWGQLESGRGWSAGAGARWNWGW
jgi:hypothetical protein